MGKIKVKVKTKEADKDYKPDEKYYAQQGGKKVEDIKKDAKARILAAKIQAEQKRKREADKAKALQPKPPKEIVHAATDYQTNSGRPSDKKPLRPREITDNVIAERRGEDRKPRSSVGARSGKAYKRGIADVSNRCVNCGEEVPKGSARCPYCRENPVVLTPSSLAREKREREEYMRKHPERFQQEKTPQELEALYQQWKAAQHSEITKDDFHKPEFVNLASKKTYEKIKPGANIPETKNQSTLTEDLYNIDPKKAINSLESQREKQKMAMGKAWKTYKKSRSPLVEESDDPLPSNYPNSDYQKIWEHQEDWDKEHSKPKERRRTTPLDEKEISEENRKHLSSVMSNTPEKPVIDREGARNIANSIRQVTGRPLQAPKSPSHIEEEDAKINEQLNTLWEDTKTKPMSAEQVKKNMIRMYGEPAEELPETQSPPPIFYKTIEPIKKKEKT